MVITKHDNTLLFNMSHTAVRDNRRDGLTYRQQFGMEYLRHKKALIECKRDLIYKRDARKYHAFVCCVLATVLIVLGIV